MAGKKYWKISLVVMVITCENIGFITRGLRPLVINPIFSLVMTITTRDIFQYFFPAIYYLLSCKPEIKKYLMSQKFQYLGIINTVTVWRKHFILKTNKNFISFVKHDICRQLLNYFIINIA